MTDTVHMYPSPAPGGEPSPRRLLMDLDQRGQRAVHLLIRSRMNCLTRGSFF